MTQSAAARRSRHAWAVSGRGNLLLTLLLSLLISSSVAADEDPTNWREYHAAYAVQQALLDAAHRADGDTVASLLYALALMKTEAADRRLVELADCYLGEHPGEEQTSAITLRGRVLLSLLNERLDQEPACGRDVTTLTRAERDARLMRWIGLIQAGTVVETEP